MNLCEESRCTGCGACRNACPKDAIAMTEGESGFRFPRIDAARCVTCGICVRACPVLTSPRPITVPRCFAARSTDARLVAASSSGGIFSELARAVLARGGLVFGAAMAADGRVCHCGVSDEPALADLRGSKYVQSETGLAYREVRDALAAGREVLFSGTPCQVAGLKTFLGREEERLLTVEVVCHGVPSPTLFEELRHELERAHGPLVNVTFRDKAEGWSSRAVTGWYADGRKIREEGSLNGYLSAFLARLSLRRSCGACPFTAGRSGADLTLGDFWGIGKVVPELDDDRGVSAVLVQTDRGGAAFGALACFRHEVSFAALTESNPSYCAPRRVEPKRAAFLSDVARTGLAAAVARYCPAKRQCSWLRRLVGRVRRLVRK